MGADSAPRARPGRPVGGTRVTRARAREHLARPVSRPGKDAGSLQDGELPTLDDLHDSRVDGVA
ncbi:MAG TPA: hypothetical protein VFH94_19870, partial [Streptomyces sp.]|nr:hypothetical protein [Streptomyces sp.]